jgi:hypothetical protein
VLHKSASSLVFLKKSLLAIQENEGIGTCPGSKVLNMSHVGWNEAIQT